MCGITGFLLLGGATSSGDASAALAAMNAAISHRGPDDAGEWFDAGIGVGLAQRRLAIIDLSPEGHQPMHSVCGRYVVVFNGEIYNFEELRTRLQSEGVAPRWRGHSDTEVLVAAVSAWGLRRAVESFNGMYAFAVWDRAEQRLSLVRDRVGEKPMYYGRASRTLVFGSELKALRRFPGWTGEIDREALALHLRYGYIPAPRTIHPNARKLPAGTMLHVDARSGVETLETYWSPLEIARAGLAAPLDVSESELDDRLESLLGNAVRLRMVSDVPIGVFLSGGIDSSLVAALMTEQASGRVRTFSIGFREREFDEAPFARAIAAHLGTDHTEFYVTAQDALAVVPSLPQIYDEPFADASQIPTFLLSRLARQQVTVALAGDGGDEVFCGYSRYAQGEARWRALARWPYPLRQSGAGALRAVPPHLWSVLAPMIGYRRASQGASSPLATRVLGLAELFGARSPRSINAFMMSTWRRPADVVLGVREPASVYTEEAFGHEFDSVPELMMVSDLLQYLPDDILVKTDRASMAVALELRPPLLDHRVVEFGWRLPLESKYRDGVGKLPLRRALARRVPREMFERPKMGFGVPLEQWLRGPLRDWAESLLAPERLRRDGLFDVARVRERWTAHRDGIHNWSQHLWNVLTVQAWLDAQQKEASAARIEALRTA